MDPESAGDIGSPRRRLASGFEAVKAEAPSLLPGWRGKMLHNHTKSSIVQPRAYAFPVLCDALIVFKCFKVTQRIYLIRNCVEQWCQTCIAQLFKCQFSQKFGTCWYLRGFEDPKAYFSVGFSRRWILLCQAVTRPWSLAHDVGILSKKMRLETKNG